MSPPTVRPRRILLVEADETNRLELSSFLRSQGYDVVTAENGREALRLLAADVPDLILTNMLMPVCDGWQFFREWKRMPAAASTPAIILTGLDVASPEWARSMGAAELLRSPADPTVLLAAVRRHLPG